MAKRSLKVKAVIFDMDGVITNTMPYHFKAWQVIFAEEGIAASHEDIYKREGQPGLNSVRELFMEKLSKTVTRPQAQKILLRKEVLFKRIVKQRFVPGTRNLIKELHQQDFRLGLVTGTARHELHKILPTHIYDLFHAVVTGNDVKHGKPHPEPFEKSLKMLKIKPREAVVIENAPFGIRSAKGAGIMCLALETSLPKRFLHEADHTFATIKELKDKIHFRHSDHE
jgi:beta-phosphoglucomutase